MYSQILTTFVALCVAGSSGFFSSGGNRGSQPGICRLPSKPCRLQVTIHLLNGTLDSEANTQTCTCSLPNRCSADWSRSDYVISRNLISTTHNMTLNMMFCQPVQPQRTCAVAEEALVVSGSMTIPNDVTSFNCRCSDSTPLLLSKKSIGTDYLIYHSYVCNNHMPTCPRMNTPCATLRRESSTYGCKCSNDSHCRMTEPFEDPESYAYCRD